MDPVRDNIIRDLQQKFWYGNQYKLDIVEDLFDLESFHTTSLKFIEIIFDTIRPTVDAQFTKDWENTQLRQNPFGKSIDEWVTDNFLFPLSASIFELIEKEEPQRALNIADYSLILKSGIYRGIFFFIYQSFTDNYSLSIITPWDIIDFLTDQDEQSLIQLLQFPSRDISVIFNVDDKPIDGIYNFNKEEFLGILAGNRAVPFKILVTIIGVQTRLDSFEHMLDTTLNPHAWIESKYVLKTLFDIISFKTIDFIGGYVTLFNILQLDHHRYWTRFINYDREHPKGQELTF
ncbi:Hypothetical protein HVR_LOCUS98 [uncultured virus]|nr:Hypothetical protein HVR_LOCUS98 [uncultured virus]